jgi:uncharacterized protein (TIRG00374 family)
LNELATTIERPAAIATPMKPQDGPVPSRRWPKMLLRGGITAAILAVLFWQVHWSSVWSALRTMDSTLLGIACLLWIPTQWLQFVKWDIVARTAGNEVPRSDIHRGYWVGYTLGVMTPGRIGQLGRALVLRNCSTATAIGIGIVERGYTALVINALGIFSLALLPGLGWMSNMQMPPLWVRTGLGLVAVAMLVLGIFPRVILRPLRALVNRLPMRSKLNRALDVVEGVKPAMAVSLSLLTMLGLASSLLQFVLLIRAMGYDIPILAGMFAALLTFFLKGMLPITIGNLGIGEWVAVYCFRGLGVEPSVAVAASLLLFFINVFIPSLIGLPFVFSLRVPALNRETATS